MSLLIHAAINFKPCQWRGGRKWCIMGLNCFLFAIAVVRSNERNETICFGQTEPITCAQGEFIFVQYAGYGYSNNTPSNSDTSWCEDPELTCADSRAASRLYGFSSSQGIPDIQVPDGNVSCDGMTQDYNYVHVRYYCIPCKYSVIQL